MYKVMIVDDNMTNLIMAKKALENDYEIVPVSSGETALEFLSDMPELPDLILLDVDMPKVNGFQVISEIKCNDKLKDIPVIFLTAQDDDTTEVEGFFLGATDYIRKPYTTALLRKRLDVHIQLLEQQKKLEEYNKSLSQSVQDKVHNLVELQYGIIGILQEVLAGRDYYTFEHSRRTEQYMRVLMNAVVMSGNYNISPDESEIMVFASKIHDIGRIFLPDSIIRTQGEMNFQNILDAQRHTILGAELLTKVSKFVPKNGFMNYAYNMARFHHERWDGKGYPDKLSGTGIPIEARMLAIADAYDEFRTRNSGKGVVLNHKEAMARILTWSRSYFDPALVDLFESVSDEIERVSGGNI